MGARPAEVASGPHVASGASSRHARWIAVVGPGECDAELERCAEEAGRRLAERDAVVVCGGLGGVMAGACRGAAAAGGSTIGLLPGTDRLDANPWVVHPIATGLGELRNGLIVRASDALLAIGGGWGTLSEIALALRLGRPVVGLSTWPVSQRGGGVIVEHDCGAAVERVLALARRRGEPGRG